MCINRVMLVDSGDAAVELANYLVSKGWAVAQVQEEEEALSLVQSTPFELVIVSLQVTDIDGQRLCREIRASSPARVIVVSEQDDDVERIVSYECGADVFFAKPLNHRVILACCKNLLARMRTEASLMLEQSIKQPYYFADWHFNGAANALGTSDGLVVHLTRHEGLLLKALMEHAGNVMSRESLLKAIGNRQWDYTDRTIDVLMARLRRKFKSLGVDTNYLVTLYGKGYMFKDPAVLLPETLATATRAPQLA